MQLNINPLLHVEWTHIVVSRRSSLHRALVAGAINYITFHFKETLKKEHEGRYMRINREASITVVLSSP